MNPHRLHLGTLGLSLGSNPKDIEQVNQTLDMWDGMIRSSFIYKGKAYLVETACDPTLDMIATHVQSKGNIALDIRFAYPTGGHCDDACDWNKDHLHSTMLVSQDKNSAVLKRTIDETVYFVMLRWQGTAKLKQKGKNFYQLQSKSADVKLTCEYAEQVSSVSKTFAEVADAAKAYWNHYWQKGAMVDFGQCKDSRAKEMERRVVLSQYLLAIQDAGETPPQETLPAVTTVNPPFELCQWLCALKIAQEWRGRLGKARDAHWDDIIAKISPLASKDSLYLAAETEPDTYTKERMFSDHPAVMGAIGLFPYNSRMIDFAKMKKTEQWIWKNWKWNTSWGWDYPMMAMGAARMGEPKNAVGALLMKQQKNTYLVSGHNYQDGRLRLYLPGNGALLMAVAMMCAGWDGSIHPNPGFPQDGNWNVKWEDLKPLP